MTSSQAFRRLLSAALVVGGLAAPAAAQTPNPSLGSYFIFAERRITLKNLKLDTACNVGVNCKDNTLGGNCGNMSYEEIDFPKDSQLTSHIQLASKDGAKAWTVFSNDGPNLSRITIGDPPVKPWNPPIIANSCNTTNCTPNYAVLEAACGFPVPFPTCDGLKPVVVTRNNDCPAPLTDTTPGNKICNLPPGKYGNLIVRNFGILAMTTGNYEFCSMAVGKYAVVLGKSTTIHVDGGDFNVSDQSRFGNQCGDFRVRLSGSPAVVFGRHSTIAAQICAPQGFIRLGDTNVLIGQFVADTVTSDRNNDASCCETCGACFE
jgi:hypothetical protein